MRRVGVRRWRVAGLLVVVGGVAAFGCQDPSGVGFDAAEFDPIPQLEALDWTAVEPAEDWDYWEFRAGGVPVDGELLGSGGRLSRDDLEPDVLAALDATRPETGFSQGCPPAFCYRYVLAVLGRDVVAITDRAGLRTFLAPVTTREEAILLVSARDLVSWFDPGSSGIRDVGSGWDLVVRELVRLCDPVQTDRVRFRVKGSGQVIERAREVWERMENACI